MADDPMQMSDSIRPGDSEDEVLNRIEAALRKIAALAATPKTAPAPTGAAVDRAALAQTLDIIIARLKQGLPPQGTATTE